MSDSDDLSQQDEECGPMDQDNNMGQEAHSTVINGRAQVNAHMTYVVKEEEDEIHDEEELESGSHENGVDDGPVGETQPPNCYVTSEHTQVNDTSTSVAKTTHTDPSRLNGQVNGHYSPSDGEGEHDYEIDTKDLLMLEPQVDLIEGVDKDMPLVKFASGSREPSVFRKKTSTGRRSLPDTPNSTLDDEVRRSPIDGSKSNVRGSKRRLDETEDQTGCRSLICDSNGIIIAEMIYRCMICSNTSDTISEAQTHYQVAHIDSPLEKSEQLPTSAIKSDLRQQPAHKMKNSAAKCNPIRSEGNKVSIASSGDSHNRPDSEIKSILKKPGNFVAASSPTSYVPGRNSKVYSQNGNSNGPSSPLNTPRGGYVTCAVCNVTKYYASVQRRYGQFTCMGCAKFFGRFLMKPRKYVCPTLTTCPLDASPRCKACLLHACIKTYQIDEKRMRIVNLFRPLKKDHPKPTDDAPLNGVKKSPSENQNEISKRTPDASKPSNYGLTLSDLLRKSISPPPSISSVPSNSPVQNQNLQPPAAHRTLTFAPPPLIKAPPIGFSDMKFTVLEPPTQQNILTKRSLPEILPKMLPSNNGQQMRQSPVQMGGVTKRSNSHGGRKGNGCRQCSNCLSEDCGKCNYCLDKPKFGGSNTLKKKCIAKKCSLVHSSPLTQQHSNFAATSLSLPLSNTYLASQLSRMSNFRPIAKKPQ